MFNYPDTIQEMNFGFPEGDFEGNSQEMRYGFQEMEFVGFAKKGTNI